MLLAGDVGGTKTLLGLFERAAPRPVPLATHSYPTPSFDGFEQLLDAFARDVDGALSVESAAIGVAGPVIAQRAQLTNVPWAIAAQDVSRRLGTPHVVLLNDLEALAHSIDVLTEDELVVLQRGTPHPDGHAAVIAAGTGLGQSLLHRVGRKLLPMASEGGHADFAPRSDREMEFARMLRRLHGRAEVEQVLSGSGIVNLHRFTHDGAECGVVRGLAAEERPAAITTAALDGTCPKCAEALQMFVAVYGAEAGNLALRGLATAGVFLGGGIAPKILPALLGGEFLRAFRDKAPMSDLVGEIPVSVIRTEEAGLLGAACHAQDQTV